MTTTAVTVFNQILIMLFIMIVGSICYKIKLINKEMNKYLSDLVLMLVNPLVIFLSYQREFEDTLLQGLLISLLLATITHVLAIIIAKRIIRKKDKPEDGVLERFAVIYSNCGFIGIPLVNGIFGSEGVFYITAYMTIFNLFVWTHGVISVSGKKDRRTIVQAFVSPSVIATISGFLLFVLRIQLPETLVEAMSYIGNMNTPLAMMVAGVTIAQANLVKLLGKLRIYYISFLKLIFIPVVMLLIFSLFDLSREVLLTSVLAAACPTGATINLFSIRYKKNYLYASEMFAVTTVLSVITIPLVMIVAELLI
ncbi:MAG TPA: AEC family transporter [Clostridiales bacterium]|mgnify:CR=1 FL=1|nr:AEC family transporter [Clostridiales bacterium]